MTPEEHQELWNRRESILTRAEFSCSYHRKREQFFALADRWDKVATLVLGAAAFTQITSETVRNWLALPFAIFASASLVFDFSERAKKHADLATRFKMLESEIESKGPRDYEEQDLNNWAARLAEIEAGEPPVYCVVVRLCQNEIAKARGQPRDVYPVKLRHRLFAHVIPFSDAALEPPANESQRMP
jgi:hypothetical protein